MLPRLLTLARAPIELGEAEVAVGDERLMAETSVLEAASVIGPSARASVTAGLRAFSTLRA